MTPSKFPTQKATRILVQGRHWRPLLRVCAGLSQMFDAYVKRFLVFDEFWFYFLSLPVPGRRLAWLVKDFFSALARGSREPYYNTTDARNMELNKNANKKFSKHGLSYGAQQPCQREIQRIHGARAQARIRQVSSRLASFGVDPVSDRWRRWVTSGLKHLGSGLHRRWLQAVPRQLCRRCRRLDPEEPAGTEGGGWNAKGDSNWITMAMCLCHALVWWWMNRRFREMELDPIIASLTSTGMGFLESRFDESKSEKGLHQIRLADFLSPNWKKRKGHGGAFSSSCVSSYFGASNNGGRTKQWKKSHDDKWTSGDGCKRFDGWNHAGAMRYYGRQHSKMRLWARKLWFFQEADKLFQYSKAHTQYVDRSHILNLSKPPILWCRSSHPRNTEADSRQLGGRMNTYCRVGSNTRSFHKRLCTGIAPETNRHNTCPHQTCPQGQRRLVLSKLIYCFTTAYISSQSLTSWIFDAAYVSSACADGSASTAFCSAISSDPYACAGCGHSDFFAI